MHTGDIAYPTGAFSEFLDKHFAVYAALLAKAPLYPCPGNHEYATPAATPYLALHSLPEDGVPVEDCGRYYSFDRGEVHFVSIDSNLPLIDAVERSGRMLEWLESDLRQARQTWKIVYFHHPPYATGNHEYDPVSAMARQRIVPILERTGVQLVLNGHEHSYQRSRPILRGEVVAAGQGITYVTTGGGGGGLYAVPTSPLNEVTATAYHYLRLSADAQSLSVTAIGVESEIIDQLSLVAVSSQARSSASGRSARDYSRAPRK